MSKSSKKSSKGGNGEKSKKGSSKSERAGLIFPAARSTASIKKDGRTKRASATSGIAMAAALEYMCSEIVELAGAKCKEQNRKRITPADVSKAIRSDSELNKAVRGMATSTGETMKHISKQITPGATLAEHLAATFGD